MPSMGTRLKRALGILGEGGDFKINSLNSDFLAACDGQALTSDPHFRPLSSKSRIGASGLPKS